MNAQETLKELFNINECPECHCATSEDTKFADFSNRNIIICAQCNTEWYLEAMKANRQRWLNAGG